MPDDQKNVELINSKFVKILKRLQNVYSEIHEARVSIKQQRTGNKKEGKYEVTVMVIISHHTPLVFSSNGLNWKYL